jgi:hypothetical protein
MFIENPLNASAWTFPILEIFHIAGFAVAIGTVALVDFRLLGLGMRHQTSGQLTRDLSMTTLISLLTALVSGMLLYSTDPDKFYLNLSFLFKMACLLLAVLFHYTIHHKVALSESASGAGKLVALVSLALWVSVVFGGIFIEFVKTGLNFS